MIAVFIKGMIEISLDGILFVPDYKSAFVERAVTDVDEFIRRMKKHVNAPELTRELCLELFEKLVIGGKETVTGKPQEIHIYYKIDIDSIL